MGVLYGVKPTTTKYGDMQFRYLAINAIKAIKRIRNETPFSPQGRWNGARTLVAHASSPPPSIFENIEN